MLGRKKRDGKYEFVPEEYEEEYEEEVEYQIVGSSEANSLKGKISNESPVGSALMGHKIGDIVDVTLPAGGIVQYKVLDIRKAG